MSRWTLHASFSSKFIENEITLFARFYKVTVDAFFDFRAIACNKALLWQNFAAVRRPLFSSSSHKSLLNDKVNGTTEISVGYTYLLVRARKQGACRPRRLCSG